MPSLFGFTNIVTIVLEGNALLKLDLLPEGLQALYIDNNPIICVENKPVGVADVLAGYEICPE